MDPLTAPTPKEVPLKNAPLVRVIAQVRFPSILCIGESKFVAPFQEAIRSIYPVLREERALSVNIGPTGAVPAPPQTTWRFTDLNEHWRLSLAPEFLALETTRYSSRDDFCERLRVVLEALSHHFNPKQIDRLGLRYVDRIVGEDVEQISELIRPEVRGVVGTAMAGSIAHSLTESCFALKEAQVLARWGHLSAGATIDPTAIKPLNMPSWILDLDMSSASPKPFSVDSVVSDTRSFAERIYTIFRWAVTDDFLRHYGGNS